MFWTENPKLKTINFSKHFGTYVRSFDFHLNCTTFELLNPLELIVILP